MLKTTRLPNNSSVNHLLKLWAERYIPDISIFSSRNHGYDSSLLVQAASAEGKTLTTIKLHEYWVHLRCQMAELQANALYAYIPNTVTFAEAKQLADCAFQVYLQLIEIYQHSLPIASEVIDMSLTIRTSSPYSSLAAWGMPRIEELATAFEPVLLELQAQHIASKDWRTLGFITTLLNFSNQLILMKLTMPEQVLLLPYMKFIEEQVAIPWQRVCAAAARYQIESPTFTLVEQMLPLSREIAQAVYRRLVQLLPAHCSRRGGLNDSGITHSCLRDLEMFQAYLWLCLLEESMTPVEAELVDLCVMVMTGVDVKWEMIELWNQVLTEEVLARVTPDQSSLLLPYTSKLQQAFHRQRERFRRTQNHIKVTSGVIDQHFFQVRSKASVYFPINYRQ